MMVGIPEYILGGLLVVIPLAALWNWLEALRRLMRGRPLVAAGTGDVVPWGLFDLIVVLILVAVCISLGTAVMQVWTAVDATAEFEQLTPRDQAAIFGAFGTSSLIASAVSLLWIYLRFGATPADLGMGGARLLDDVRLGVRWFTMLVVPVILLQLLLTRWYPSHHPLVEMLKETGDTSLLPVAAYAAVVTAPIFEELLFRLWLQGWCEKVQITLRDNGSTPVVARQRRSLLWGAAKPVDRSNDSWPVATATQRQIPDELAAATAEVVGETNPYRAGGDVPSDTESAEVGQDRPVLWTPILVSSTLFSLAHFSHGPDWAPLFLLALGLGYLYQRTRRIQVCVVVHMLVNLLGVLMLWAEIVES